MTIKINKGDIFVRKYAKLKINPKNETKRPCKEKGILIMIFLSRPVKNIPDKRVESNQK